MTPTDTAALVAGALVLLAVVVSLLAVARLTRRQARSDLRVRDYPTKETP